MERNSRKTYRGVVVSDKNDKTIVVEVANFRKHPLYGKRVKLSNKFHAHDENNEARVGDYVAIQTTRPLSKKKHYRLLRIITRAQQLEDVDISDVVVDSAVADLEGEE